jgi:hypothetical protein
MKVLICMFAVLAVSAVLMSGCTAPSPEVVQRTTAVSTAAPLQTASPIPTVVPLNTTESTATASVTSPIYETKVFRPAFTVELPPGWYVAERDPKAAQIFLPCKTCIHEGEENGEITLDMALSDSSASEAMARLQMAKNIDASPSEPVELGSLSGFKFTAARTGNGEVAFQNSGYGSEAAGLPIEVYVVTAAGQTITIFIDPHESSGSAAGTFKETALAIVKTIHFTD